ncbi:Ribbon-helix-helix protein, copG family [Caulifigura coniformis]|uniref:Ribbon-helix-helix protein, copG family n=1 Tax=Caulifigura coniformis TaxID=2527983 RepID=A0A517SCM2_9PLAN|nr:ribbon-helix-helix protein, CopG family [Caulifigura coniformis]QDT53864.1 Ribbon-helix-helix protein, copG family [Caulifigura coniformis]
MERINVTCRLPAEDVAFLDQIAINMERDRSYLIKKAVEEYIASQRWQLEEIDRGLAEIEAGQLASDDEVEAAFRELGA